jgi:hypothetical protein
MLKKIAHIPALFSISITFIMLLGVPPHTNFYPSSAQTNFYILNYLYVFGIGCYIFLEFLFLDLKKFRFRRISLMMVAFLSLGVILDSLGLSLTFPIFLLSPLIIILLLVFSFLGSQPKITEGRFYPAIFGFLSAIWIIKFVGATQVI